MGSQNTEYPPFTPNLWVYGAKRHCQQYCSYIVAVSFIDGENHGPVSSH